jgi:cold shock CspA family protein
LKLVAACKTPSQEVPALIAAVHESLESLGKPRAEGAQPKSIPPLLPDADPRPAAVAAPRRPRGRPRKAAMIDLPLPAPAPVAPPAPKLMRRADVAARPAEPAAAEPRPTTRAALRGIVKWYDPRTRSGAVRLPGYSGDVSVGPEALERAGIPRLFKGQEIEASVTEVNGHASLLTLSLPGRPETDPVGGIALGAPRRNARPVVIEMKKDALRRVAARVEAEQLLGPTPRPPGTL